MVTVVLITTAINIYIKAWHLFRGHASIEFASRLEPLPPPPPPLSPEIWHCERFKIFVYVSVTPSICTNDYELKKAWDKLTLSLQISSLCSCFLPLSLWNTKIRHKFHERDKVTMECLHAHSHIQTWNGMCSVFTEYFHQVSLVVFKHKHWPELKI